jgi:uncharacterized protein (DUF927 family)
MPGPKKRGGKAAIRDAIAAAETVDQAPAETPPNLRIPGGVLEMQGDGLYKVTPEYKQRVCGPFQVLARTREDDGGTWGLLLTFKDPDQRLQHVVIAGDLYAGEGAELHNLLARRGLYVNPAKGVRGLIAEYLSRVGSYRRARIVARTGWHRIEGVPLFVLPGQTFGTAPPCAGAPVEVLYQPGLRDVAQFNAAGTLDDWREAVAALCAGNSRLVVAVSAAFAGPVLELVGEQGGGLHFYGAAQTGKTTALEAAASVWGGDAGRGARGYFRTWRATSNALEGIAAAHSDALLLLDELGEADPREVGSVAYMLANGQGRSRADRSGALRAGVSFRVLFLSTGEVSLTGLIGDAGQRVRAGQEVRFADISADAGAGKGMFEDIHDFPRPDAFARAIREGAARAYGTAAVAFLEYVTRRLASEPDFTDWLRGWVRTLTDAWLETYPEASGQVRSVARRFAVIAVAGELASMADITSWPATEAQSGAEVCFRAWLAERGTTGSREDADAVAQLRNFLTRHGDARFHEWRDPAPGDAGQGEAPPPPPTERFRTVNRAGWKRRVAEGDMPNAWHYYLSADGMAEALTGLDRKRAHRILIERGFLCPGLDGKAAGVFRPPGHGKMRLYHVLPAIFVADDGDA